VEKYCRVRQATDDNMTYAHGMLITKTTNTHSEYVILIAFPLQQRLHERASMLRYTYIASLVFQFFSTWSQTPSPLHLSHDVYAFFHLPVPLS
jgi:hypothetical protein